MHKNGIYNVTISDKKGAIKVKQGDWISKYSAAIYNDFTRLAEFGRMNGGLPVILENPNDIYEGEIIYYLPDYWKSNKTKTLAVTTPKVNAKRKLSEKEKQFIVETLKSDFQLKGNNLKTIQKVIDIIGKADNALALAEIAGFLNEGSIVAGSASVLSFISTALFPIAGIGMLADAHEIGQKLYGLRAVAYTITAWAYDKPILVGSNKVLLNIKGVPNSSIIKYKQAWSSASRATLSSLKNMSKKKKISEDSLKLIYKALSSNNPKTLCLQLMTDLESKLNDTVHKMIWKVELKTLYPE